MEATVFYKNLISKAIRHPFSILLVTQTTPGPRLEGTCQEVAPMSVRRPLQ